MSERAGTESDRATPGPGDAVDRRLGQLLVEHGLLGAEALEQALLRRAPGRDLARLLIEEGLVPRYAVETVLRLGGAGLRPLDAGSQPPAGDWRSATTRGAAATSGAGSGAGSGSVELGSWPAEVFAPSGAAQLAPRGRLGRFELLEELGHGGGGWVFRARDPARGGSEVALKVLRRASEVAVQRFLREAEAVARLRHPHIVPLLEQGQDEGRHWLAFELVRGRSLLERCEEPGWTPARAAAALRDAARALEHAHQQGVLHRDVKPGNVLVDEVGRGRVLDFGLARLEDQGSPLTSSGAVLGTVRYMAPEQAFPGSRPLDARTDVWGLGATLYHALTRRPPFPRGPLPGERLVPPRALDPALPPALERVILCCLEEDPARRYPGAGELARDLERFLAGERVRAPAPARRAARAAAAAALLLALGLAGTRIPGPSPAAPDATTSLVGSAAQLAREEAELERLLRAAADVRGEDELLRAGEALARAAGTSQARALLCARLDELSGQLRTAASELVLGAEEPDPVEQARGEPPFRGLRQAVEHGGDYDMAAVQARLESRLHRQLPAPPRGEGTPVLTAAGALQAERLGRARVLLARAICLALARLAGADEVPALARYLEAEASEERAIPAGRALARAGTEPALRALLEAVRRHGPTGRFAAQILPGLAGVGAVRVDSGAWTELAARGDLRLFAGDAAGAREDYQLALARAPGEQMLWNRLALAWRRLGKQEQAGACFDMALACEPGAVEPLLNRSRLRLDAGDIQGAETDARAALSSGEKQAQCWLQLSQVAAARRDRVEALRACEAALALDPAQAGVWNQRGQLHLALGHLEQAEADFTRALELEPTNAAPLLNRATTRSRRGDPAGARADATRALELDPRDPLLWIVRGDVRREAGDIPGALGDFQRALELDPGRADAWDGRAVALRLQRDLVGALQAHDRAVALEPRVGRHWLHRAGTLQEQGERARARSDLDRALELDPANQVAWNNRAALRRLEGDPAGAGDDATRALELAPDYPPALLNRALARVACGDPEGARADLDRAIALDPRLAQAWQVRGRVHYEAGELERADADFTRALELDPHSASSWSSRGGIRHRQGREREALADLDRALELDPRQADAWGHRGLVKKALGDPAGGLQDLDRAVALEPKSAIHPRNRAVLHLAVGDPGRAEVDLGRSLELDPAHPDAWQSRASLRIERGDLAGAEQDLERLLLVEPKRAMAVRALRGRIEELRRAGGP